MSRETRLVKFDFLIQRINHTIKYKEKGEEIFEYDCFDLDKTINTTLGVVFDNNKLNDYGKIIVKGSSLFLSEDGGEGINSWADHFGDTIDLRGNIFAAKQLVYYCNKAINRSEAYKFLFWAMMILTVDKTDAEEYLSLICDFARMFNITDDEMEDILSVIKIIYQEDSSNFKPKTETVSQIFQRLIQLYS